MLSMIRQLLDNWIVRAFFVVLIGVFVFWGVSSVVMGIGASDAIATVGGQPIKIEAVNAAYQRTLNAYATQNSGREPSKGERRLFADQALGTAIDRAAMELEARRMGVVAPPAAIRQQVFAIPAFHGPDGKFDKATFNAVLANHNLTPAAFMAEIASGLKTSQIIDAVTAGVSAPAPLVDQIFAYAAQERTVQFAQLPFAAANPPPAPAETVLRRYWRDHPGRFSTPALRDADVVVLSPALIARGEAVSQAEIAAQYQQEKAKFAQTPTRTVEIITAEDAKNAAALAKAWKGGADWAAMQKAAAAATATAIVMTDAKPSDLPSATLAKAAFAATPGEVSAPVKGALGTYVFKVTKAVAGGDKPLSAVADQIRAEIQLRKARNVVDNTLSHLQDALAGSTALGKLPASLHLAKARVSVDREGMTVDGKPAGIPGPAALRQAIVKAIFATAPGNTPQAVSGPGDSYYAIAVHRIIKPALKPYDKVKADVLADWTGAQVERQEEVAAAKLLTAVKGGKTLAAAASAAGLTVTTSAPMTRAKPAKGVPPQLAQVAFSLKKGAPTMVQTQEGFVVGVVSDIAEPKPGSDKAFHQRVADSLGQSMQEDVLQTYAAALRQRDHVKINTKLLNQISN
ncbi:peptidylprolyl isomerase [Acidiphilium sp.]|uniref:peptidylprolyl isomerase n=1 Tax=Acidiphilium sp. TaxID=527 RepID=UPI002587F498|nr:peptidylprolyl isomerase [Acidiphilium sp.]